MIFSIFNVTYSSIIFWYVLLGLLILVSSFFPEFIPEIIKLVMMLALILLIGIIVISWIIGGTIPYTTLNADNNTIIAIFTIILAIATIINTNIYRKMVGFSRLSEVDFDLNSLLCLEVKNKGEYPVRNVKIKTKIFEKGSSGFRKLFDKFSSPEDDTHYISSKKDYIVDLREYLSKRFNIWFDNQKNLCTSSKKRLFRIRIMVNYYTDNYFKNSLPIIKEYEVEVGPKGSKRKEIKPTLD